MTPMTEGAHIGRFELVQSIGEGSFGAVWAAREDGTQRWCALRLVRASSRDPLGAQILLSDARSAARVAHENLAAIISVGQWDEGPFVVSELVEGESLAALAERIARPFAPELVVRIGRDICAAVHAAHEVADDTGKPARLVHRAISPRNVFVSVTGRAKVADLGLAIARERMRDPQAPETNAKLSYMAPEQVRGEVDRRSDVWAIGAVLYRLLAGRAPFEGQTEAATVTTLMGNVSAPPLPPNVTPALAAVLLRAVARRPEERYPTAQHLGDALCDLTRSGAVTDLPYERVGAFVQQYFGQKTTALRAKLKSSPGATGTGTMASNVSSLMGHAQGVRTPSGYERTMASSAPPPPRGNDAPTKPPPPGATFDGGDGESTRAVSAKELFAQMGMQLPPENSDMESTRMASPQQGLGATRVVAPTGPVSPSASLQSGRVSPSASLQSGRVSPSASFQSGPSSFGIPSGLAALESSDMESTRMVPSEPQTLARPGSGEMYTAAPAPPPRPFGQIDDGADGTSTLMLNEGAGRVPSTLVSAQPSAAPKQPIVASGPRAEMTQMAGAAIDFAEFFNLAFKKGLEGAWPCRIELTAPAGQSTGGGTQAMQHIRLVPDDGSPTLVIGSVNRGLQRVELRTYAFTANMYAQRRKGMVFPVDEPRFTAIIDRLQNFFTSQRYDVGRADSQVTGEFTASQLNLPRPPGMGQADEKRPSVVLMLAGLVVVALVAGVVTSMVMAKRPPLRVPAAASTAK